MIRFNLIFFTVFLCGVHFGNCADQLEFWERDPKFDARRMLAKSVQKNVSIGHGKIKLKHKIEKLNTTKSTPKPLNKSKPRFKKNLTDTVDGNLKQLRMRKDSRVDSWPRAQKPKLSKHVSAVRSTRMPPMYLNQKPKEKASTTKYMSQLSEDEEYKTKEKLSPYNLRQQLEQITSDFFGINVTFDVIGRTAEYNDIILLKATEINSADNTYFRANDNKYMDETPEKRIIFIVHGLSVGGIKHLPCLHKLKQFQKLLGFYFAHLDKFDIFLIPLANPDGVKSNMKLWNKNMSPQSACAGVALDRNFDVAWNISTISSCSQQYPGSKPFSEPETKAIREVFHHYGHKIIGYFHVHAGTYNYDSFKGDAVLYPKGYTDVQTDEDKFIDLRGEIDEVMKNASFQVISVTVDTLHNWYGKVSGTSVDYASTVYGVPYALELVMQPYENDISDASPEDELSSVALSEIWKRVIEVLFNNIWKNINNNDV